MYGVVMGAPYEEGVVVAGVVVDDDGTKLTCPDIPKAPGGLGAGAPYEEGALMELPGKG